MAGSNALFRIMKDKLGNLTGITGLLLGTDPVAGETAALVAAAKDSNGKATVICLTEDGSVPVSDGGTGVCVESGSPNPSLAATDTLADVTGSAITLTVDKSYLSIEGYVSAMSESCFQLVQDDNGTETVLQTYQVGPGQYTFTFDYRCKKVTAGSTGVQELKLKAANAGTDCPSTMFGWIAGKESV